MIKMAFQNIDDKINKCLNDDLINGDLINGAEIISHSFSEVKVNFLPHIIHTYKIQLHLRIKCKNKAIKPLENVALFT